MSTQQTVKISEEDLKAWAIKYFDSPEYLQPVHGDELVVRKKAFSHDFEVHIYSSLKIVLYDAQSKMVIRTYRLNIEEGTTTIPERLTYEMNLLYKLGQSQEICPKCGSHMVERENGSNGNKFMGCTSFPVCPRGGELRRAYPLRPRVHSIEAKKVEVVYTELVKEEDCIPTNKFPQLNYSFEKFNRVQSTLLQKDYDITDCNLVLGTSTSSGKTVCAELFMYDTLKKGKVVLYVSPLKSLAEEKSQDWTKTFADYKLCMVTGDYRLTPERAAELANADIIILTSEMIDSRTRNKDVERSGWINDVGLVILDEFHIIATGRGHCVEAGLMRFTKINPDAQVLCLSATAPNVEDFRRWLQLLNGKHTAVINSDWRPTQLHWDFIEYNTLQSYKGQQKDKINKTKLLLDCMRGEKTLCFVHDKNTGKLLLSKLRAENIHVEFHSADVSLEDRLAIEEKFENEMDVLIATSTLAWGKNTSAKNVIIVGVTRGMNSVDELDIIQMAGRAGRVGRADEGFCHVICEDADRWEHIVNNPRTIGSALLDEGVLGFHILAEVKIGVIKDFDSLKVWFERSLAFLQEQWDVTLIQKVLDDLVKWKMLHMTPADKYVITELGRVSASLYYRPQDIHHWNVEFSKVHTRGLWDNDLALSWALGSIPSQEYGYIPKEAQDRVLEYSHALSFLNLGTSDSVRCCDLYDLLTGNEMRFSVRDFRYDAERICEALTWIDKVSRWDKEEVWKQLPLRLKYGIGRELLELCAVQGIGRVKARKLYAQGVLDLDYFTEENKTIMTKILGAVEANNLIEGSRVLKRLIRS